MLGSIYWGPPTYGNYHLYITTRNLDAAASPKLLPIMAHLVPLLSAEVVALVSLRLCLHAMGFQESGWDSYYTAPVWCDTARALKS